jgi:hypothetical protein
MVRCVNEKTAVEIVVETMCPNDIPWMQHVTAILGLHGRRNKTRLQA